MYEVHKYMALDTFEVGYFIQQVGLAAQSLGIDPSDVKLVENTLQKVFGERCAAPTDVVPWKLKELQAICVAVSFVPSNSHRRTSQGDRGKRVWATYIASAPTEEDV
jgi:hypothetical protein